MKMQMLKELFLFQLSTIEMLNPRTRRTARDPLYEKLKTTLTIDISVYLSLAKENTG